MPYASEGTLTTDTREVAIEETWDSQTDWTAYQSASNVDISNGIVRLAEYDYIPPENAVHNWQYSAGSGTTATDFEGDSDGTLSTDAMWSGGTWVGSYSLLGDGTDDYVELGTVDTWSDNLGNGFAVILTFQTSGTFSDETFLGSFNDSSTTALNIGNDASGAGDVASGEVSCYLRGESGGNRQINTTSTWNDGNKHRLVVQSTNLDAQNVEIWIDGNNVSQEVTQDSGDASTAAFQYPLAGHARNVRGSIDNYTDSYMDNIVLCSGPLTQTEIQDDYNAQPWV